MQWLAIWSSFRGVIAQTVLAVATAVIALNTAAILTGSMGLFTTDISLAVATGLNIALVVVCVIPDMITTLRAPIKLSDRQIDWAFAELESAEETLHIDPAVAAQKATHVIKILPRKAEAYRIRARAHWYMFHLASALKDYNKAISLEPGYLEAYWERANILGMLGEYEKAVPDMLKAMTLDPSSARQLVYSLAESFFAIGEFDKAEMLFKAVLNHPDVPERGKKIAEEHLSLLRNLHDLLLGQEKRLNSIEPDSDR